MASPRRTRAVGLVLLGALVALAVHFGGGMWPSAAAPSVGDSAAAAPAEIRGDGPVGDAEARGSLAGLRAVPRVDARAPDERPWRVRGRVTDVAGAPVPDADVVLSHAEPGLADRASVRVRTLTGADGSFRLSLGASDDRRRVGDAFVSATGPDRGALSHFPSLHILPIDAEGEFVADLVLYPVGTLTGRVLGADDAPVPGAEVEVWARWANEGTGMRRSPCDPDGRFRVEGLFGTISCRAYAAGHRDDASHLGTIPVGATLRKELRLIRRSAGLRLRCVDPEAKPVAGLGVAGGSPRDFEDGTAAAGTTDADGQVSLEGLAPHDQVSLRIEGAGDPWCCDPSVGELEVGDLAAPPVVTIPLLRGARVRGIVRASTGEPVGPGYVVSLASRGTTEQAGTDASGRFAFERPIPAGAARIDGSALPEPYDVEVTAGTCELDVVVEPCVRVEARLVRPDGTPLRGRWPRPCVPVGLSLGLEADPDGLSQVYALDLEQRAEGGLLTWAPAAFARRSWIVLRTVSPPSRVLARSPRLGPIRTGATARVDLVVPPDVLATVHGRVRVPHASTPVFSFSLQLAPLDARPLDQTRHAFFWSTDRFELLFVLPGRYELSVHDMGRAAVRAITVPETGVLEVGDIELERR